MKFKFHMPNFMEFDPPPPIKVRNTKELLKNLDIKKWKLLGQYKRFSQSTESGAREFPYFLMLEQKNGHFWVIGYCDKDMGLPEWNYDECKAVQKEYESSNL